MKYKSTVKGMKDPIIDYKQMAEDLKQENEQLKEFAIWMTGCGYDFTQHDYFIKQRDKLLKNKE